MAERRYKIYEQLGAGGNGAVFRAYDAHLKRWVAIKRLLSAAEAETSPDAEELRREADMLASLRNANIVTIFDVSTDEEGLFMVMELLEGPDLADTIQHGPLMLEDFKQLAEQTLEALLAAHNLRILHRDLKPENIKVERLPGGRFQAKIIDFGLARSGLTARKQTEDQAGSVMGSIYYMAPEQLSREPTDIRTDLYSLGCVFYESLSSRKAFDGKTVNEVIDKHLDHDFLPLNQLCPHLPQWLTYWVMRLMACKPEDRPANAQQAIEEFRAWEKLPPSPQMMPWMPVNYGYGAMPSYGPTASQPIYQQSTGSVPVQTGGYYPPHITSSSVPVPVVMQAEPIPVAVAVQEIPKAMRAPPPARPGTSPSRTAHPALSVSSALEAAKKKKIMIIGGSVVAMLLLLWMMLGGGDDKATGNAAKAPTPASGLQIGPVREDLYPTDRSFPIPDHMRVAQFIAKTATRSYSGSTPSSKVDGGNLISVWEDLAKRGGNNVLASRELKPDYSPERVPWTTPEGGIKDGRIALRFMNKFGKPVSMRSYQAGAGKDDFAFGKLSPPSPPGLTLAVVMQANGSQLPCRVITLLAPSGKGHVTLSITSSKSFEAEFKSPSGSTKLTSAFVEATQPSIAILIWNPANDEVQLRTRDQYGRTHKATGKAPAPSQPLCDLEIGGGGSDKARMYSGLIADVVMLATAQKEDQTLILDKELRDHYFNPPKPGILNPTKNSKLSDFRTGEERSLFNGRDLSGWEGNSKYWSVKEGALTVKGDPNSSNTSACNLVWKDGTVSDFDLSLKFKASSGTNSGIHYRSYITGRNGDGATVNGYQLDLDFGQKQRFGGAYESGVRNDLAKTGERVSVRDHSDLKKATLEPQANVFAEGLAEVSALKTNQWYDLRILAEGNLIKHFINGKQVCEYVDEGRGRMQEGIIALEWQVKSGATGQFKDIRVKRLR